MRALIASAMLAASTLSASASCLLTSDPCWEDKFGNSYRTERNFGGGYTTYRNGLPNSYTNQTPGGSWQERFSNGSTRIYNYDPYDLNNRRSNPYGYR